MIGVRARTSVKAFAVGAQAIDIPGPTTKNEAEKKLRIAMAEKEDAKADVIKARLEGNQGAEKDALQRFARARTEMDMARWALQDALVVTNPRRERRW